MPRNPLNGTAQRGPKEGTCHGGIFSKILYLPHKKPIPVGPHILWPDATSQSTPKSYGGAVHDGPGPAHDGAPVTHSGHARCQTGRAEGNVDTEDVPSGPRGCASGGGRLKGGFQEHLLKGMLAVEKKKGWAAKLWHNYQTVAGHFVGVCHKGSRSMPARAQYGGPKPSLSPEALHRTQGAYAAGINNTSAMVTTPKDSL